MTRVHFFLFLFSLMLTLSLSARQPAVDPIMGISIDEYKQTDPAKDPGYKFSEFSKSTTTQTAGESTPVWPTVLILIGLPVAIMAVAKWRISIYKRDTIPQNTINLDDHRQKKDDSKDEDDDKWRKAS